MTLSTDHLFWAYRLAKFEVAVPPKYVSYFDADTVSKTGVRLSSLPST